MQVTDIDSGTSLSIQALEQSSCCKRKNASKEQIQYSPQRGVRWQPECWAVSLRHKRTACCLYFCHQIWCHTLGCVSSERGPFLIIWQKCVGGAQLLLKCDKEYQLLDLTLRLPEHNLIASIWPGHMILHKQVLHYSDPMLSLSHPLSSLHCMLNVSDKNPPKDDNRFINTRTLITRAAHLSSLLYFDSITWYITQHITETSPQETHLWPNTQREIEGGLQSRVMQMVSEAICPWPRATS